MQLQCPIQSVKTEEETSVDRKNMKIDDWLVKVRVVDEKTRLKRDNNTEAKNGSEEPRTIDLSGLDHKHTTAPSHFNEKHSRVRTASVIVLEEQDRSKRRKQTVNKILFQNLRLSNRWSTI